MEQEKVIVIDFGGQYNQLVARRVRECNVYCEIYSYRTSIDQIRAMNPSGIILTGGPNSCYEADSPTCSRELFELGVPVLGLCYGAQLMQLVLGGEVCKAPVREYGKTEVFVNAEVPLFAGVGEEAVPVQLEGEAITAEMSADHQKDTHRTVCWMSHTDYIRRPAPGFAVTAHTADCPVAAAENASQKLYAIQFHPEVLHTREGSKMLYHFVRCICGCAGTWRMDSFVEHSIQELRNRIGDGKVLLALSGGVDSSVAAALLARAIGNQLTCVFVDHGLLRKNEGDEVEAVFGKGGSFDLNFVRVDASQRYYSKLAGVTEPENKRKIIGEEFIRVFEEEARKIGRVDFLAQGTIYPDVVESGLGGESAVIKSHHNVGGLPEHVDFKEIIEPLRDLFKDEVRKAGLELGIPESLVFRQPFPGPGLGIRIIGDVTEEKVHIVQEADAIYREEIERAASEWATGKSLGAARNDAARNDAAEYAILEADKSVSTEGTGVESCAERTDGNISAEGTGRECCMEGRGGKGSAEGTGRDRCTEGIDGSISAEGTGKECCMEGRDGKGFANGSGVSDLFSGTSYSKRPDWMPDQYFAALTNMRSVGVMGDERTYDYAVALRAVRTVDFMTAECAQIPFEVLQTVMSRIINEVKGVNRVFFDLTSKPPGTIEME